MSATDSTGFDLRIDLGTRLLRNVFGGVLLFAAAALLLGSGHGMPLELEQGKNTLVRVNVSSEIRDVEKPPETSRTHLPDYNPKIIQLFSFPGLVLDDQGHVLTFPGYRWVDMQSEDPRIEVVTQDGQRVAGRLVGIDQSAGVAVIRALESNLRKTPICTKCRIVAGSTLLTPVLDASHFFELRKLGVISAERVSPEKGEWRLTVMPPTPTSGEPVLDTRHNVVGFVGASHPLGSRTTVVPISQLLSSAETIIRAGGDIRTGWLGIYLAEARQELSGSELVGIMINRVQEDSPAQKAGLRPRDVVVRFNGNQVFEPRQFIQLIETTPIGAKVGLEILRQGRLTNVSALVEARKKAEVPGKFVLSFPGLVSVREQVPATEPAPDTRPLIGIETVALNPSLAEFLQIPVKSGLLVSKVEKDFPASQAGIMVGDVITTVEGEPIIDPQTFSFFISQRRVAGTLNVKVLRKGAEQSAVIELK